MKFDFDTNELFEELEKHDGYWLSFLEKEDFEAGVLKLEPDTEDIQQPHSSDEIYFIVSGDGYLTIEDQDYPINAGSAFYVPKNTSHRFHSNTKTIQGFYALN